MFNRQNQSKIDSATKSNNKLAQVRRLLVFQLKLGFDALRDILLSPLSIVLTVIDLIEGKSGKDSHFEKLLRFGRRTERRINLFNQHDKDKGRVKTVDSVVEQIEDIIVKEYREGELSAKARVALEKSVSNIRKVSAKKKEGPSSF